MRLEANDLAASRGGRPVFAEADFTLEAGDVVALVGPNGSGKSTLLRALAGLVPAAAGDASLEDADGRAALSEDRDAFQARVLYAGHLDAVKPTLDVRENLAFWARYYGARETDRGADLDASLDAALEAFDLAHLADAPAARLSAGQKRRLGLARLAAIDRPLWLLDEPTTALDAASTGLLSAAIAARASSGGIVIAATHAPLGLEPTRRLDMAAFTPRRDAAEDPFLVGDWI